MKAPCSGAICICAISIGAVSSRSRASAGNGFLIVSVAVGVAMLAPFADYAAVWTPGSHWFWLAGLGLIHSGVCYVLFYSSYPRLQVATIAVLAFIYPVIALLLDYLVYGRTLAPVQSVGVALIVLGTLGVNLKWQWRRRPVAVSA